MTPCVLINESRDASVTPVVLETIGRAVGTQLARDYAPAYGAPVSSVEVASAPPPPLPWWRRLFGGDQGIALVHVADRLGVPSVLGYHDADAFGRPRLWISLSLILQHGGTLTKGSNSLSAVIAHEVLEAEADPEASAYVPLGVGRELAREACDPVEGDSYEIDGVAVSNFVTPEYFGEPSRRPVPSYDAMGLVTAPLTMRPGGYQIVRDSDGVVSERFARRVDEGGMPEWRRAAKRAPGSRRMKRKGRRST
jgi:hypothetical protein